MVIHIFLSISITSHLVARSLLASTLSTCSPLKAVDAWVQLLHLLMIVHVDDVGDVHVASLLIQTQILGWLNQRLRYVVVVLGLNICILNALIYLLNLLVVTTSAGVGHAVVLCSQRHHLRTCWS